MNNTLVSYRNMAAESADSISIVFGDPVVAVSGTSDDLKDVSLATGRVYVADAVLDGPDTVVKLRLETLLPAGYIEAIQVAALLNVKILSWRGLSDFSETERGAKFRFRLIEGVSPFAVVYDSGLIDAGYVSYTGFINNMLHVVGNGYVGNFKAEWTVQFPGGGADPGNQMEIFVGGVWVGPALVTDLGLEQGWTMSVTDIGDMALSNGGQGFPSIRIRSRALSASFAPVEFAVAFGNPTTPAVMDIQRMHSLVGVSRPCIFIVRCKDASGNPSNHVLSRLGIYGHFKQLGQVVDQGGDKFQWSQFEFEELL